MYRHWNIPTLKQKDKNSTVNVLVREMVSTVENLKFESADLNDYLLSGTTLGVYIPKTFEELTSKSSCRNKYLNFLQL